MPHANRNGLKERENPKGIFNKLVNIGVILTLAILVSKVMRYISDLEEIKKITNTHAWFHYIWGILAFASVVIIILLCIQTFSGKKIIIWNKKENVSNESKGTILARLIGIAFVMLLLAATYSCFQAGARHQAERGLLATQGRQEPPRERKLRIIKSETIIILEPGQISTPIKVEGTQYVSFHPSDIPNSDVTKLFYFPYNGGYNIVTNRIWDKTTHSVGYEMRLKSERVSGPVRIEVAVGWM